MADKIDLEPIRLTPTMRSSKLALLAWVTEYILRYHSSPSTAEMAAGVAVSQTRIKHLTRTLIAEGLLVRGPGQRGLLLPDQLASAIWLLRRAGYRVDDDIHGINASDLPLALPVLPPLRFLPAPV